MTGKRPLTITSIPVITKAPERGYSELRHNIFNMSLPPTYTKLRVNCRLGPGSDNMNQLTPATDTYVGFVESETRSCSAWLRCAVYLNPLNDGHNTLSTDSSAPQLARLLKPLVVRRQVLATVLSRVTVPP